MPLRRHPGTRAAPRGASQPNGDALKVQTPEFLTQLIRSAMGSRPDVSLAPQPAGPGEPAGATSGDDPEAEHWGGPQSGGSAASALDPGIVSVLAEKVLLAWLRNRYQLLFPFALNLRSLDRSQAELLVHAMIAAAQADGSFDRREQERIEGTLSLVNASESERRFLDEAMGNPKPLNEILGTVHDMQTGALVYAASLMALDERKTVNRYYLKYLAARLQLSEELTGSLEQRYRSST